MMQTYMSRRRGEQHTPAPAQTPGRTLPVINSIPQTPGRQVDLPGAIREKMEASFGADLSGVKLYESQAVADAGAEAMTMGNQIGFAPGKLDFASSGGQSLLGHELSHVVSQARGEVTGSGFLNDHALEARADREGAMAAAGESVYTGPVTPISSSAAAAGPMQAKKDKRTQEEKDAAEFERLRESAQVNNTIEVSEGEKDAYEKQLLSHFTGEDRKKWQQQYWNQRVASAKALNQIADEQGDAAAYTSGQSDHFQSFSMLLSNIGIAQTNSESYMEMSGMHNDLSDEDKAAVDRAVALMANGPKEKISYEQLEKLRDNSKGRAKDLRAKRLKRKKKDRW